ncbi:MAG: hypothetical protein Q8T11_14505 [Elusimicrobiota bacterium]|nr:hypothetical protein [Elusimicrobiota bacterium]
MTFTAFLLLMAAPAAATPAAMSATLEALSSQAAADPAALTREGASVRSGQSFDRSFTIRTLAPVEYVAYGSEPRKSPPPVVEETAPPAKTAENPGEGADYYFEGKKPLNGITIYTPVKGEGSTSAGEAPTAKYGTYGKYAMIGGAALLVVGAVLGGGPLVGLALVGGLLIGAGAVLSFLFGKKK